MKKGAPPLQTTSIPADFEANGVSTTATCDQAGGELQKSTIQ